MRAAFPHLRNLHSRPMAAVIQHAGGAMHRNSAAPSARVSGDQENLCAQAERSCIDRFGPNVYGAVNGAIRGCSTHYPRRADPMPNLHRPLPSAIEPWRHLATPSAHEVPLMRDAVCPV